MPGNPNRTQHKRIHTENTVQRRTAPPIQIILTGKAVQKLIDFFSEPTQTPPSPDQTKDHRLRPTLRPWISVIDEILKDEANVPRRYRTTAMEVLKTLREDHGFAGGYTVVQEYVRQARNERGQSPSRRSHNSRGKRPEPQTAVQDISTSPAPKTSGTEHSAVAFAPIRLSLQPRRPSSSPEQVFDWMQSISQGKFPLEALASELKELPSEELKLLFAAATKGQRSNRNKALAMLAYARGINSSPICSFLQISQGSLFRYLRDFRQGGTEKLFLRKPRSDKKACIPDVQNAVFSLLHSPPSEYGFNRTTWRLADMKPALGVKYNDSISCDVIREIIVNAGWKWRLARRVSCLSEINVPIEELKKLSPRLANHRRYRSSTWRVWPSAVSVWRIS